MINDVVQTENTEGNGGLQSDDVSGQQSPDTAKLMSTDEIGNERVMDINKKKIDHGGHGGPQADFVGECESSEFKRNLNGCPEADSFGERQLENNKYPQMSQMDTDGCPQADGEVKSNICYWQKINYGWHKLKTMWKY